MMGRGPVPPLSGRGREQRDSFVRKRAHSSRLRLDRTAASERRGRHRGSGHHSGRRLRRGERRPRQRERGREATARRRRRGTRRSAARRRRHAAARVGCRIASQARSRIASRVAPATASSIRPWCGARHPASAAVPRGRRLRCRRRGRRGVRARTAAGPRAAAGVQSPAHLSVRPRLRPASGPTRQRGEDLCLTRRPAGPGRIERSSSWRGPPFGPPWLVLAAHSLRRDASRDVPISEGSQ